MTHPVGPRASAMFHGGLAVYFALGLGFHVLCAWRHWRDG